MSFGQKPGAWARQPAPQNQQLNPNLFGNPLGAQLGNSFPGQVNPMQLGNINALVNQAAFNNNLNMIAQARQLLPQQQQQGQRPGSPQNKQPNQRTFVGTVTKLMDTYGFIDEDVFFQTSVIRGAHPRVGDRVMVDATFNPSMPFKWNGYRVQLIQEQPPPVAHQVQQPLGRESHGGGASNRWGSVDRNSRDDHRPSNDRRAPASRRSPRRERSPVRRSPQVRKERTPPPKRLSPKRETIKRERSPRPSREPRARSPVPAKSREADSPPRRRQRIIPRYTCYIPRPFVDSAAHYTYLHKRYPNLYIPSDFVRCDLKWPLSFNLEEQISFAPSGVPFCILSKDVDYPGEDLPVENPADSDSKYVVKVLLLTHPGAALIRQKVTGLLADGTIDEAQDCQNLNKVLQVLVGMRGKSEFMGIGGAWSPSLDGENPLDPQTLINTAVRTTKASVGVDLQNCPVWYQMAQIHYHRADRQRHDIVTLMLPDVSATPNLCPDPETYKRIVEEVLPNQLKSKLEAIDAEQFKPSPELIKRLGIKTEGDENKESEQDESVEEKVTQPEPAVSARVEPQTEEPQNGTTETEKEHDSNENGSKAEENDQQPEEIKPTHWSELIVKAMKVADLREELDLRGIDSRGVKNALAQRLQEALDKEKEEEENNVEVKEDLIMTDEVADETEAAGEQINEEGDTKKEASEEEKAEVEQVDEKMDADDIKEEKKEERPKYESDPAYKKELEQFERQKKEKKSQIERHYTFPKEPAVLIYPSKSAKGGKFNCKLTSLQTVLDYRLDDNKEASFEVFLFAEALKEAIDRSNAFGVFHILNSVLDKETEKKRRDESLAKPDEKSENGEEKAEEIETENIEEKKEESKEEKKDDKEKKESTKDKDKKENIDLRTNFRALVNNVSAFQAFTHFDINGCGYLNDRDLEEVVNSIGLDISRSTISKIVKKVSSRDRFNYRNITDKWVDKDGNTKYFPEPAPEAPSRSELLKQYQPEKAQPSNVTATSTPDVTENGVVFYKGTVLNITQTLEAQKKVDNERSDALLKIEQLEVTLKSVKEQRDRYDKKRKHLEEDLEKYKKRLYDAEKCLKNTQDDTVLMKTSLLDAKKLGERLVSIVDKVMPPPKREKKEDKEKSDKKEKDEREKESKKDEKEVDKSEEKSEKETSENEQSTQETQPEVESNEELMEVSNVSEESEVAKADENSS
ncbi:unnamed protein product [Bursaphelenchus xylophilus]|uniref:(pine wood nematode) hypothetical protein n=1 Tax=Bursaphelenchus xylophilus TaxID=6326 RepID=A0A1I7RHI6_BURXY|nr:unnamed protein product [Bursaphelenchus xylophilus]CAG9115710.1 unnamed protein product [Bursaphelenchus xylophilus]